MTTEQFSRLQTLCLGYAVLYEDKTQTTRVRVYSVEINRSPAYIGELQMKRDEWTVFHNTIYQKWEELEWDGNIRREEID